MRFASRRADLTESANIGGTPALIAAGHTAPVSYTHLVDDVQVRQHIIEAVGHVIGTQDVGAGRHEGVGTVSYTHLDVYKRQVETELEGLRGLGAAAEEALAQNIERRGLDEDVYKRQL